MGLRYLSRPLFRVWAQLRYSSCKEYTLRHGTITVLATLLFKGMVPIASAQDTQNIQSYTPDYFAQFQPNTARDMVSRIPGFTLQGDENGERGFGQANLNILINGRRPSSKSSDANDILGRIPAKSVKRIDIVDGTTLDIPGLSGQVANIISTAGKLSGNWEYIARFEEGTEPQLGEAKASINGSRGNLEFVASIDLRQRRLTQIGEEQFFDGSGQLIEDRTEDLFSYGERPGIDLNLTYTPDNDHVANLNLSGELANSRRGNRETFTAITAAGTTGSSISDNGEDEYNYEIGGDYSFPIGNGNLKLIGLHTFENSDLNNAFVFFEDGAVPFRSRFDRDIDEGEFIARGEYSWKSASSQDWQVSWEGAFNFLDSTSEFTDSETALTLDNVRVEEQRTEANITTSWELSEKINIQTSLGAEYSQLEVTTVDEPARTFFRPKGFISASYDASDKHIFRARLERDVGQLNFNTFVSSVDLTEDVANSGNSQIVPTQFWNGEIEVERKGGGLISGTAKVFARFIEDPIEQILFADGSEGPGNLDNAFRYGVEGNMTWLLDKAGLKGGELELEGILEESTIEDPVTLLNRSINDTIIWRYDVTLRQDIPNSNWAWGVNFRQLKQDPFFRLDQSFEATFIRPSTVARLTHKNIFGTRVDLFYQNFLDTTIEQERLIFDGNRNGPLLQRELFARERGHRFSIAISDTF